MPVMGCRTVSLMSGRDTKRRSRNEREGCGAYRSGNIWTSRGTTDRAVGCKDWQLSARLNSSRRSLASVRRKANRPEQGEQRSVAHLALNPVGKVPVIIDRSNDGRAFVLSQSNAILLYVADKAPGKLLPLDNLRRALVLERFFYFITDVISISHAAFQLRRDGGDSTFLDRTTLARLEFAEHYFSDARFVAGNDFSLADIAAFSIAFAFQEKLDWRRLPRLGRWFQEVAERETVQRGLRAFDCVPTA